MGIMNFLSDLFGGGSNVERTCVYCNHYSAGDIDRNSNFMSCAMGHRLLNDGDEGWVDESNGTGEPMYDQNDCPDWSNRGSRFHVHSDY